MNIGPYGKNILTFLSETTETFDSKLGWNVPWVVMYEISIFFVSIKNSRWPPPHNKIVA